MRNSNYRHLERFSWKIVTFYILLLFLSQTTVAANFDAKLQNIAELKRKAELNDARFLAPNLYQKANATLQKARETLASKPSSKKIAGLLEKSEQGFVEASRVASSAKEQFAPVIAARQDAIAAQAIDHANTQWNEASKALEQLIRNLEKQRVSAAQKRAAKTELLFREAELQAIKNNYLDEARQRIARADENNVAKYSPALLEKAKISLSEAAQELNQNRYDTDLARSLARQAKIDAGHALLITENARLLRKKKTSYEALALAAEQPLHDIAESLDLSIALDEGTSGPTSQILAAIAELKQDSLRLQATLEEVDELSNEVARLNTSIGEKSDQLEKQAAFRERLQNVEDIFNGEAARVYRQDGSIRISAYGFNFKPGKSELQSSQSALLKKMMQAIRLFPECQLLVEGHTDSHGSDALNLKLSQERAENVGAYLEERKSRLGFTTLSTIGYGESAPVANNETKSGREKNRRIELVIKNIR